MKYHKINKLYLLISILFISIFSACLDDLNTEPLDPDEVTSVTVYEDPNAYIQVLAKLYAGLAVSGQQGPAGQADISGIDEGFSQYLRQYWKAQEVPTDEAVIGWSDDEGLLDYNYQGWTASNQFVAGLYNRIYYQITLCNEFIRETTPEKLDERGIDAEKQTEIARFRAEARFLRALSYWHALDVYGGKVPFVTEEDATGSFLPDPTTNEALFTYIESELLEIEEQLVEARLHEYARADKATAWTLLAKLYLNATVYVNQNRNSDCVTYCQKILDAGYSLENNYEHLFLTENHLSNEIIFPVAFDGSYTKTWGGMTFLVHAPVGGTMDPDSFGINGGWDGIRTTKQFVEKFDAETDGRALFHTDGQTLEIEEVTTFTNGYAIAKYKNVSPDGTPGVDPEGNHPDTDYPMFRLADVYLMYAEAVKRGGGGSEGDALMYINDLRERAYGDDSGNVASYDLDFVLDERARELYWEAHRRTDLIRYGRFTGGDYLWAWKGNTQEGAATAKYLDLFPIPSSDIIANPNLIQNTGY